MSEKFMPGSTRSFQTNNQEKNIIARGLQYKIEDLGNGRVRKILNTIKEQEAIMANWAEKSDLAKVNKAGEISAQGVMDILKEKPEARYLFGNPEFEQGYQYTQDKVIPVREYIAQHSLEENKKTIERFISTVHELWKLGVGEVVFNFDINNGLAKDGTVVQLDFGEVVFEKNPLIWLINDQSWLKRAAYKQIQDKALQEYIAQRFNEEFSLEKLDQFWQKNKK